MTSFRKSLSIQLGLAGVALGAIGGFVIRDEYYFPSYKRADDLIEEYYTNDKQIDQEIEELNKKLKVLQLKSKAATAAPAIKLATTDKNKKDDKAKK